MFTYMPRLHTRIRPHCAQYLVLFIMRKMGVLQLGLQLTKWVAMIICNSFYFYTHESYRTSCMSCKIHNSPYKQSHSNSTHLQFCCNSSFSTIMLFPYDYNHNVMLISFFTHSSKLNMRHYEDFLMIFKINIDIHNPLWLSILDGFRLWHVA
jgi:hypothetical protein